VEGHVSASTQNQAFSALLFLYQKVLEVDPGRIDGVIRAQRPKRLPVVLSQDEVWRIIAQLDGVYRLIALIQYGAGLRLLECLGLRIKDPRWRQQCHCRPPWQRGQRPPDHVSRGGQTRVARACARSSRTTSARFGSWRRGR